MVKKLIMGMILCAVSDTYASQAQMRYNQLEHLGLEKIFVMERHSTNNILMMLKKDKNYFWVKKLRWLQYSAYFVAKGSFSAGVIATRYHVLFALLYESKVFVFILRSFALAGVFFLIGIVGENIVNSLQVKYPLYLPDESFGAQLSQDDRVLLDSIFEYHRDSYVWSELTHPINSSLIPVFLVEGDKIFKTGKYIKLRDVASVGLLTIGEASGDQ